MARIPFTDTVVCNGCGVEVTWAPVVVDDQRYCCLDCAEGRPCECDYPPEEERGTLPALPELVAV